MSSDDDSTALSSVPSTVPSRGASRKNTKKPASANQHQKGRSPPIRQDRSITPTRQEQRHSQYRAQELTIANGFAVAINEGWSNAMTEVGMVHVRDKRSDDGKRTYKGVCVTVFCGSKSRMDQTTIRLATRTLDRTNNRIILGVPKLDESIKNHREDLIESFKQFHGKCPSRDEGIRRSFAKVLNGEDMQYYELTLQGVGNLTNSEWQGDKSKNDPCYLKVNRDALGEKVKELAFVASVEIACIDGMEDVSSEESDSDDQNQRRLAKKLSKIGYDDDDESDLEVEESEESDGELVV